MDFVEIRRIAWSRRMEFYTYLHCKPNGDPFYVGKGHGQRCFVLSKGRNLHHRNIIAKYGRANIRVYIFPCGSEDEALRDEIQQIAQLRSENYQLANLSSGGDGPNTGISPSEELRKKLSIALIKACASPELRMKRSAHMTGRKHGLGYKHSKEELAKMSTAKLGNKCGAGNKGNTIPQLVRDKIANTLRGRKRPAEVVMKVAASMRGKKHSAETRARMSLSQKARFLGSGLI